MLRRITSALFEAPAGQQIQVVTQSQRNNGVNDARFEYAGNVLDREQIQGLPGCTFIVAATRERLQAVVAFDEDAPGDARYDLFEVESGSLSNLRKNVSKADGSPLIDFAIDAIAVAVAAGAGRRRGAAPGMAITKRRQRGQKPSAARKKRKAVARKRPRTTAKASAGARKTSRKAAKKTSRTTAKRGVRSRKHR